MFMHDVNNEAAEVILLVPPMLATAADMKLLLADRIQGDYRYLLADLSAHGDGAGAEYVSAAQEAKQIHAYLTEHHITHLKLAFGASLGGAVLFELLRYEDIVIDKVFFEGVSFYEHAPIMQKFMTFGFLKKKKQAINEVEKSEQSMARKYGMIGSSMLKQFQHMSEQSIRNIVRDCGNVRLPKLSAEVQRRIVFACGKKDMNYKQMQKIRPGKYPKAQVRIWDDLGHCEKMLKDPDAYAHIIEREMSD